MEIDGIKLGYNVDPKNNKPEEWIKDDTLIYTADKNRRILDGDKLEVLEKFEFIKYKTIQRPRWCSTSDIGLVKNQLGCYMEIDVNILYNLTLKQRQQAPLQKELKKKWGIK